MSKISKAVSWLRFQVRRRTMRRTLPSYLEGIGKGDVVLDCGANVGAVTVELAKSGARVFAFEPDAVAFDELERNVAGLDNVNCIEAAVSTVDGKTKLFHRPDRVQDELLSTQGSSLERSKENVDETDFQLVDTIDLARFIAALKQRVACIKMDIEGHEAAVLEHLLDNGALEKVDVILVETHERKVPGLAEKLETLKPRIAECEHLGVDWNWV